MVAILFFLLFSANYIATAQQRHSNISPGSSLTPTINSSWLSPSGLYAFGFYRQGSGFAVGIFLAGVTQKTVVWTANRDNPPVPNNVTLLLSGDGRLILRSAEGQETNIIDTSVSVATASIFDSGNFILYSSDQEILWQGFDNPTDTLLPGQRLVAGIQLFSSVSETDQSTGIFRLNMQHDGNLVQYPKAPNAGSDSYWASNTAGSGDNASLNLDVDGHLYLLNSTGFNIKNLTPGGYSTRETIYLLKLDADGILRLYSYKLNQNGNRSIIWTSSNDRCSPTGLCGLNGYCIQIDQDIDCQCLPGFAYTEKGSWASGCAKNFTSVSCQRKDSNSNYTIESVANTIWENTSYSVLSPATKEDCEAACLEDCICEAALFKDGICSKQKLPLRFGRRLMSGLSIALIKVGVSTSVVVPREEDAPEGRRKKEPQLEFLIVSVSLTAFAFTILAISGFLVYRSQVHTNRMISSTSNIRFDEEFALKSFTYMELQKVTNNFCEEVGKGAFGSVFRGEISHSQKVVAVKKLERISTDGEREFQTEMKVIGRTHHRNLVRLIGYCHDGPNRLLVYEYMSNGSLADILFTHEKQLCWDQRKDIACSVARGLIYLHEECEIRIIHCDIKPQNILMDENRCAKISDFGLAKLLNPDQTKSYTGIRGTRGYVAPEWHRKMPVTVKADVYSFGIVLLEIICCRRTVDWNLPEEEAVLEAWVYHCFQSGQLQKVVGDEDVDSGQLERMVKVGLWCIQYEPSLRPPMKKVLLMLEEIVEIPLPPNPFSLSSDN